MKIQDEKVSKLLERLDFPEITESIFSFPDLEKDGRTDMEIFIEEVKYFYEMFSEDTVFKDDLDDAKEILYKTKYGKQIPLNPNSLKPLYSENRILQAKNCLNEFKRLQRLYKKYCE